MRRQTRSLMVDETLATFFESTQQADRIRHRAQSRVTRVLAAAENAVREPIQRAVTALGELRRLGETQVSIAELTGLSRAEVRAALNGAAPPGGWSSIREPPDRGLAEDTTEPGSVAGIGAVPGEVESDRAEAGAPW